MGWNSGVRADDGSWDRGVVALGYTLRRLQTTARVLHIGAHPDDEDSALLAYLARGRGVRTAYLSLTRGEGGQNSLGPELYEALGVLRTLELLAARRLDGAEQYFTRAFDFGFSKTAEETLGKWGHEAILEDIVRCIRRFRPHVIVSRFRGDPSDGHGHHQAAGQLAQEAFTAAADPARFPEQLSREGLLPWQALKLYTQVARDSPEATLRINTGEYDPLYGRSCYEIAMAGRSQHRCQNMGCIEARGAQFSTLRLLQVADGVPGSTEFAGEKDLLAGLEVSLGSLGRALPGSESWGRRLTRVERLVGRLHRDWQPARLQPVREGLELCLQELRAALDELPPSPFLRGNRVRRTGSLDASTLAVLGKQAAVRAALEQKEAEASRALALAAGIQFDVLADDGWITPGQTVRVTQQLFAPDDVPIREVAFGLTSAGGSAELAAVPVKPQLPLGWTWTETAPLPGPDGPARARADGFVRVADTAEPSSPYWLLTPRSGDRFDWPNVPELAGIWRGDPFQPPVMAGRVELTVGRTRLRLEQPGQYRHALPDRGEVRQEVQVVPTLGIWVQPSLRIVPWRTRAIPLEFTFRLHNFSREAQRGELLWEVQADREPVPVSTVAPLPFDLDGEDSEATMTVAVVLPPVDAPTDFTLRAGARTAAGDLRHSVQFIHYPHIPPKVLVWPAVSRIRMVDVQVVPHLRVGYIMGTGDEVPAALAQLGVSVTLLDDVALQSGDLSAFDTVLVGIRAYEVRPALRANNRRLLEWVRHGGTLIVQYNQDLFGRGTFAPYPLSISRPHDRVTVEDAPVTFLQPAHPLFHFPNEIGPADFEGWVQERGLYFLHTWDDRYTPLLECHDPGEAPQRGGLVVAEVGRGKYVYTGLAWFRQLPAGVPGAYRFLANLISLGHTAEGR